MNIEQFREYCLNKKEVTEHFPFNEDTLVFKVCNKMFALASLSKWEEGLGAINLKCDPEYALQLRAEHDSIVEGWHMSKKHWNTVNIYQGISPKLVSELIDHSYDMVIKGLPKKVKETLK